MANARLDETELISWIPRPDTIRKLKNACMAIAVIRKPGNAQSDPVLCFWAVALDTPKPVKALALALSSTARTSLPTCSKSVDRYQEYSEQQIFRGGITKPGNGTVDQSILGFFYIMPYK